MNTPTKPEEGDLIASLAAALVIARDYIAETHEELMRSVCLFDAEGNPRRETADPEELKTIEWIEGHLATVDAAINQAAPVTDPASEACRLLVNAYCVGLARGGSVDWSDVDAAHAMARQALGIEDDAGSEGGAGSDEP